MSQIERLPNFIPLKGFVLLASRIDLLESFATIKNSKRDRGHPCLSSLVDLKNVDGDLLIKIAKEIEDKQPIIQFVI